MGSSWLKNDASTIDLEIVAAMTGPIPRLIGSQRVCCRETVWNTCHSDEPFKLSRDDDKASRRIRAAILPFRNFQWQTTYSGRFVHLLIIRHNGTQRGESETGRRDVPPQMNWRSTTCPRPTNSGEQIAVPAFLDRRRTKMIHCVPVIGAKQNIDSLITPLSCDVPCLFV